MDDKAFILSKKFRTAIERAKREGEFDSDPTLKHFPKACCCSASSLLEKFLYENGIYTYEINATKHCEISWDNQSHTWLMLENGCILDITGDQFKSDEEFPTHKSPTSYGGVGVTTNTLRFASAVSCASAACCNAFVTSVSCTICHVHVEPFLKKRYAYPLDFQ